VYYQHHKPKLTARNRTKEMYLGKTGFRDTLHVNLQMLQIDSFQINKVMHNIITEFLMQKKNTEIV